MTSKKRPQKVIGIDIGSKTIKMVEVLLSDRPTIIKWASLDNTAGAGLPVERSRKELIKLIKKCRKNLKPTTSISSLCLDDPTLLVKELSLPAMGQKELLENIRFELSEYFSNNLSEFHFSYRYVKNTNEIKGLTTLLVAALPLALLSKYTDMIQSSGLTLKYIDVPANAISKLLRRIKPNTGVDFGSEIKEVLCIADIGGRKIDVSIYEDGNFVLNKTSVINVDHNPEDCLAAISQVIDYYHRKNYSLRVLKVMLIGGGAYKEGLSEFLSVQIGLPVEAAKPDMLTTFDKVPDDFPVSIYFNAIGAAMRED